MNVVKAEEKKQNLNDLLNSFIILDPNDGDQEDSRAVDIRKWKRELNEQSIRNMRALEKIAASPDWERCLERLPPVLSTELRDWKQRTEKKKRTLTKRTSDPDPKRRKRWDDLNREFYKEFGDDRSVAFSSVTWKIVGPVFNSCMETYTQDRKPIGQDMMSAARISLDLTKALRAKGESINMKNEAIRSLMISLVVLAVVRPRLNNGYHVDLQESIYGEQFHCHGRYDIGVICDKVRILLIECKKEDMQLGYAQDLVTLEVASDIEEQKVIFGIVTNFIDWTFFKSCDDKIYMDDSNPIRFDKNGDINSEDLQVIIDGMLSSE